LAHFTRFDLPSELRADDPEFAPKLRSWAFETQCDMNELVSKTQATINTTRALMAEVDRALARKMSPL
jgi:hypothetical protein